MSPYLRFGQLSARHCHRSLVAAGAKQISKTFTRRVVWRDLAYWQLHHFPRMSEEPIRAHYAGMRWRDPSGVDDSEDDAGPAAAAAAADDDDPFGGAAFFDGEAGSPLCRWQEGRTGYPLVDAGMRELRRTGWMQQSVRMVCAAFLVEYLRIHWVHGALWFHDNLVDADLAINSMMWQNAGKSGIDQWNFTMSPSTSHQDPKGDYVRRWCPELTRMPSKYVHSPWTAPASTLAAAGVELGVTYPRRMLENLAAAKAQSAADIIDVKVAAGRDRNDAAGYDIIDLPKGSTTGVQGSRMRLFTVQTYRTPNGVAPTAAELGIKKATAAATAAAAAAEKRKKRGGDAGGGGVGGVNKKRGGAGRGAAARGGRGGRGSRQEGLLTSAPPSPPPPPAAGAGVAGVGASPSPMKAAQQKTLFQTQLFRTPRSVVVGTFAGDGGGGGG